MAHEVLVVIPVTGTPLSFSPCPLARYSQTILPNSNGWLHAGWLG